MKMQLLHLPLLPSRRSLSDFFLFPHTKSFHGHAVVLVVGGVDSIISERIAAVPFRARLFLRIT